MDDDVLPIVVAAAFEIVALVLAVGLWRGPGRVVSKLLWTGALAVPAFGAAIDRPPARDWDLPPPPGT